MARTGKQVADDVLTAILYLTLALAIFAAVFSIHASNDMGKKMDDIEGRMHRLEARVRGSRINSDNIETIRTYLEERFNAKITFLANPAVKEERGGRREED